MLEVGQLWWARLYRYSICIKANDGAAKATRHAEDVRHVDMRRQNSWCETSAIGSFDERASNSGSASK
jgi:hypothetical protein